MTTRVEFAVELQQQMQIRPTWSNNIALVAWMSAEDTQAQWNPLATTQGGFAGESDYNSAGVKNYPDLETGLAATVATLGYAPYAAIVDALHAGNSAAAIAEAIDASPWGTSGVTAMVGTVIDAGDTYQQVLVAGSPSEPTPPTPPPSTLPPEQVMPQQATVSLPWLEEGDSGWIVRVAQAALNLHGAGLATDGLFGPLTKGAAVDFQRAMGLSADGVIGPATWPALLEL